jgi:hypothetical protein
MDALRGRVRSTNRERLHEFLLFFTAHFSAVKNVLCLRLVHHCELCVWLSCLLFVLGSRQLEQPKDLVLAQS